MEKDDTTPIGMQTILEEAGTSNFQLVGHCLSRPGMLPAGYPKFFFDDATRAQWDAVKAKVIHLLRFHLDREKYAAVVGANGHEVIYAMPYPYSKDKVYYSEDPDIPVTAS